MVTALTNGNYDLLKYACRDAFHENYRSKLIKGFYEVKEESNRLGALATYLSGAGPTIMAMISDKNYKFKSHMEKFLEVKSLNWAIHELSIDKNGAIIIEGDK